MEKLTKEKASKIIESIQAAIIKDRNDICGNIHMDIDDLYAHFTTSVANGLYSSIDEAMSVAKIVSRLRDDEFKLFMRYD